MALLLKVYLILKMKKSTNLAVLAIMLKITSRTVFKKNKNVGRKGDDDPPTPPVEEIDFAMDGRDRKNTG